MCNHWVAVASREHVLRGVEEGICQVCHGKSGPLRRMKEGDWIVYYSSKEVFGEKGPCQKFTAIGRVTANAPYPFQKPGPLSPDFVPWRRDVEYLAAEEVAIAPLLDQLSFIPNKQRWGFPFRRGCFTIPLEDFQLIASAMGVEL